MAWAVALAMLGLITLKMRHERRLEAVVFWGVSLVVFVLVLLGTSVGGRFADIADGDRSALNRLGIWANALKLIHAAPLTGWGAGESGNALVQWFEPVASNKEYASVVSTYLHFGAEFGLPALGAALWIAMLTIWIGCDSSGGTSGWRRWILVGAVVGFTAFLTAALFSTLWVIATARWILFSLVLVIWFLGIGCVERLLRKAAVSVVVACSCMGCIYFAGSVLSLRDSIRVRKFDGGVRLSHSAAAGKQEVSLVVDRLVLGSFYGRQIRGMLEYCPSWREIAVCSKIPRGGRKNVTLVIFGPRYQEFSVTDLSGAVLVCPVGPVPEFGTGKPRKVILPQYDEFGFAIRWRKLFAGDGQAPKTIEGVGQDCSAKAALLGTILADQTR